MSKSLKASMAAVAVAACFGVAQTAKADALAASDILISNLLFQNAATNTTLDNSNFALITFSSNAQVTASLNGLSSTQASPPPLVGADLYACAPGSVGCPANNTFPVLTPPPTSTFASADQFESGAPITGLVVGGTPVPAPAKVDAATNVSLTGQGTGTSTAQNTLTSTFQFQLNQSTNVKIVFDAQLYLDAFIGAGSVFPTNASASSSVCFTVTDAVTGAPIVNWCPGLTGLGVTSETAPFSLNTGRNRNAPVNGNSVDGPLSGSFSATTVTLTGGTLYNLNATETSTASALVVPEPSTLALLGLGLFGFTFLRRRFQ